MALTFITDLKNCSEVLHLSCIALCNRNLNFGREFKNTSDRTPTSYTTQHTINSYKDRLSYRERVKLCLLHFACAAYNQIITFLFQLDNIKISEQMWCQTLPSTSFTFQHIHKDGGLELLP